MRLHSSPLVLAEDLVLFFCPHAVILVQRWRTGSRWLTAAQSRARKTSAQTAPARQNRLRPLRRHGAARPASPNPKSSIGSNAAAKPNRPTRTRPATAYSCSRAGAPAITSCTSTGRPARGCSRISSDSRRFCATTSATWTPSRSGSRTRAPKSGVPTSGRGNARGGARP
jgi:hypothetical protein